MGERENTYQDSRIVGHVLLRRRSCRFFVGNLDVLHITSSKNDETIFFLRRGDEFSDLTILGAEGEDVLESNSGLFGIDLMKGANISRKNELDGAGKISQTGERRTESRS